MSKYKWNGWQDPGISRCHWNDGRSKQPLRQNWRDMIRRCTDEDHSQYATFGGRGIKVCRKWMHPATGLFAMQHDLGPIPKLRAGEHIEVRRYNTNGNYTPSNCYLLIVEGRTLPPIWPIKDEELVSA